MFVQNQLLKVAPGMADQFSRGRFLVMFGGVVIAPLVVFILAGRDPDALGQPSLLWSWLALAVWLLIGMGGGLLRFRQDFHAAAGLSIAGHIA